MDRQEGYMKAVRGNVAYLCMVPVTVEGAIPLLAFQDAVVNSRLAVQATADPQGLLQVPGKHLPLPSASLVPVHVVVLGASILVQQEGVDCHVVDQLQAHHVWVPQTAAGCPEHDNCTWGIHISNIMQSLPN